VSRDLRRMADLTWTEFRDLVGKVVLVVPLGAVEQHGYHLPLDTDNVVPTALGLALAERVPAVVAPSFTYGYKSQPTSGGGGLFPGTTSFDGATFTACVRDLIRDVARWDQSAFLFLNGNYENTYFAIEGIDLAVRDLPKESVKALLVNWWEQIPIAKLQEIFAGSFPGWEAEHAGIVETSLMMYADPERVIPGAMEPTIEWSLPTYTVAPEPPGLVPASGVLRGARGATPEIGREIFEFLVERLEEIVRREFPGLAGGGR
jgi:creatinine amidohydrolase